MTQFNRYQDDKQTRARIILEKAFEMVGCDKVITDFKKLLEKLK